MVMILVYFVFIFEFLMRVGLIFGLFNFIENVGYMVGNFIGFVVVEYFGIKVFFIIVGFFFFFWLG